MKTVYYGNSFVISKVKVNNVSLVKYNKDSVDGFCICIDPVYFVMSKSTKENDSDVKWRLKYLTI